jgi:DNA-binding beta-propeller fold protein YncE
MLSILAPRASAVLRRGGAILLAGSLAAPSLAGAQSQHYRLESATTLAGASPSWDYLTFEPGRSRLFIGRRGDGVTVYDVTRDRVIAVIERSQGANATALAPEVDRGFTANEDGSTTMFELSTLRTLDRLTLGTDADAAVYEPSTRQVAFTMGDSRMITFVDAATGKIAGRVTLRSAKLDGAAADGEGALFVAERDRDAVARIDARRRAQTAEWKVPGCHEPTGLAYDRASRRIFVGCRGRDPVLAVLDSRTGRVVARQPIGRGNDGVIFDAAARRVITSNGVDANLVIYEQTDPNHYRLADAPTTRPFARTMALDPATRQLYLVTAEGTVDVTRPAKTTVSAFYPNRYFDGTFTVLRYGLR